MLKQGVEESENTEKEEIEEVEWRKERDKARADYERKLKSGEIKPYDPDGKLERMSEYLHSSHADIE